MASQNELVTLLQSATEHFQRRSFAEAERICSVVLGRYGEEANALMIVGLIRMQSGQLAACVPFLERALNQNPKHVHVLNNLGSAYRLLGQLDRARAIFERLLEVDNTFYAAHNNLGNVYLDLEQREAAARCYHAAVALKPDYSDAIANLARIAEETHRLDEAERVALRALAIVPGHLQAQLTLGRVMQRQGKIDEARSRFEALLRHDGLPQNILVSAHGYLAECFDKQGRYLDAFRQFEAANELQHAAYEASFGGDDGFMSSARIEHMMALLRSRPVSGWTVAPDADRVPVFLIGYPRSGTTLLDQILSSHPMTTVLEERDTLVEVCKQLMPVGGGIQFWSDLALYQIEQLRALYWNEVDQGLRGRTVNGVFVDKLPLNAALLPLIHRIFPQAPILLAIRDPRDSVLSCFQQRFGMNRAMFQMLRLKTAAQYYDKVMSLVALSRELLPLRVHEVRYESVVTDFDAQVGAVLSFLNLPWDERVRNYAETAKARQVNTPSSSQVVQPLYTSSIGKWRKYSDSMSPVLPILAPWVAAYGYAP